MDDATQKSGVAVHRSCTRFEEASDDQRVAFARIVTSANSLLQEVRRADVLDSSAYESALSTIIELKSAAGERSPQLETRLVEARVALDKRYTAVVSRVQAINRAMQEQLPDDGSVPSIFASELFSLGTIARKTLRTVRQIDDVLRRLFLVHESGMQSGRYAINELVNRARDAVRRADETEPVLSAEMAGLSREEGDALPASFSAAQSLLDEMTEILSEINVLLSEGGLAEADDRTRLLKNTAAEVNTAMQQLFDAVVNTERSWIGYWTAPFASQTQTQTQLRRIFSEVRSENERAASTSVLEPRFDDDDDIVLDGSSFRSAFQRTLKTLTERTDEAELAGVDVERARALADSMAKRVSDRRRSIADVAKESARDAVEVANAYQQDVANGGDRERRQTQRLVEALDLVADLLENIAARANEMFGHLPRTVLDIVRARPDLSILNTLLAMNEGLSDLLEDDTAARTLFAPTDDAFAQLDQRTTTMLLNEPRSSAVVAILRTHVLTIGAVRTNQLDAGVTRTRSAAGSTLSLQLSDAPPFSLRVNGAPVIESDIVAANGVVHVLSEVIRRTPVSPSPFGLRNFEI